MSQVAEQHADSSSSRAFTVDLREVPGQLREVPALPFRASRHLTAWIVWQTSRVTVLSDHPESRPPTERVSSSD